MHILLPDGIHDRFHRHVTAQVDDLKAIIFQDDPDDVLADVVDIALDGGNDDASLAGTALALLGNGGLDLLKGPLRGGGRLQQLRQEEGSLSYFAPTISSAGMRASSTSSSGSFSSSSARVRAAASPFRPFSTAFIKGA